jgi:cytoskeletal protein CcmA (bactofilin family)
MIKAKRRDEREPQGGPVISIIGPGMEVTGDLRSDGTIRIEGQVKGTIHAGKAVVVGKDGVVEGDITTQDAVLSGRVVGTVAAGSRLEIQASARIEGEIHARRVQLDEGAVLNGRILMGDALAGAAVGDGDTGGASSVEREEEPALASAD